MTRRAGLLPALLCLGLAANAAAAPRPVTLWHSYRGAEEAALQQVTSSFNASQGELHLELLAQPNEGFAAKLTTAIPRDNGPDLFVFAHERIGGWARMGIAAPLDEQVTAAELEGFLPETVAPLRFEGKLYGLPLAAKSVALFYNRALVPEPPRTTEELLEVAARLSGPGAAGPTYGLAYLTDDFFFHAAWYFGFGGELLRPDGSVGFDSPGSVASLAFVRKLQERHLVPEEPTGALVTQLFNEGRAAMVVNGPWFIGEISANPPGGGEPGAWWAVASLPIVSETGKPASPFLTAEAVFVSTRARSAADALAVARYLAGPEAALVRGKVGGQLVASARAWQDPDYAADPVIGAFRRQLPLATPMDNRTEMGSVWEPAKLSLKQVLRGAATPELAARAAQHRLQAITRPPPPPASPQVYVALGAGLSLLGLALLFRWAAAVRKLGKLGETARGVAWIAPALGATAVLIFVPFVVGLGLSLYDHRQGTWTFIGLANFVDILSSRGYGPTEPLSFYYALGVTILWTVLNVGLHVGFGLALALLLNRPLLKLRGFYRVILIVPWAVPNYITALIWKGMFHKQYGAINGLLEALGIEGVAWFSKFWTGFFANVCANAWLGFPFMMVVSLGALQSIPKDLYEAADVDGASAFDKLRHITLPLLKPALIPAVLLGTVWTFNQFNIVYLVSGGEPDNATDILVSEAYRWAFARQEQYGYAAAYAAIIFVILLAWSAVSGRVARAAETMQ